MSTVFQSSHFESICTYCQDDMTTVLGIYSVSLSTATLFLKPEI